MSIVLGAIADDFTGATDLANTLVSGGMRVAQVIGVPDGDTDIGDAQAVVVALKSRTAPVADAVAEALASLTWLQSAGAEQIFFKYCSTFDSSAQGNIGPVADALMQELAADFAFVCPAYPENARTIYKGNLYVGDELLAESPMKDHPLTPMTDSNLVRLMAAQSKRETGLIQLSDVMAGPDKVKARIAELVNEGISYGVIDAVSDSDLETIGRVAADHKLITGGSGIALALPSNFAASHQLTLQSSAPTPDVPGRGIVIAGSCSTATRAQIKYIAAKWPCQKLDIDRIAAGEPIADEVIAWAQTQPQDTPILVYASSDPSEVKANQQRYGIQKAGEMIETTLSSIAVGLVQNGATKLIIAGGETSGAVVSALNIRNLEIGVEIDPGVPWTRSLGQPELALALKSGNFGSEDFFEKALGMLP